MRGSLIPARVIALAAALASGLAGSAAAQDSKSSPGAKELAQVLATKKMDAIAARDPNAADTFLAALAFPNQLIVVSAKYPAPPLLNEKIAQGNYRDVYIELNSASIQESRYFITDLNADGLRAKRVKRDDPFDVRDQAGKPFNFDGSWREDKISEAEYMKVFAESDERYSQMLAVLLGQAKK